MEQVGGHGGVGHRAARGEAPVESEGPCAPSREHFTHEPTVGVNVLGASKQRGAVVLVRLLIVDAVQIFIVVDDDAIEGVVVRVRTRRQRIPGAAERAVLSTCRV